jgi:hypothetical protein
MEKDFNLKMVMSQIFWHWGYVPLVDVKLIRPDAPVSRTDTGELTDIDVLGIKFLPEYKTVRTAADCTTRRKGAMGRAFFLRGILDLIGAYEGYVLADPNKTIQQDHRTSSRAINITLIDPRDAQVLLERLKMNEPLSDESHIFSESAHQYLEGNLSALKPFQGVIDYRKFRYWQDPVNEQVLNTIFAIKDIAPKLHLREKFHLALAYEYFFLFSMSILELTWRLAPMISPSNPDTAELQIKYFLYGGEKYYKNRLKMIEFVQNKLGISKSETGANGEMDITPPEWKLFLETYIRLLINPTASAHIPQVLRLALFEKLLYRNADIYSENMPLQAGELTYKLIADLARYYAGATGLPKEFIKIIESLVRPEREPETDTHAINKSNVQPSIIEASAPTKPVVPPAALPTNDLKEETDQASSSESNKSA